MGDSSLKCQFPRLYVLETCKQISIADKLRYASINSSFRRLPTGGAESEQYHELGSRLAFIDLTRMHDRWVWSFSGTSDFSVNSVRNLVDDSLISSNMLPTRWVKVVPIKINVFAWKVQNDKLSTKLYLSRLGIDIHSIMCPILCRGS